jgi:hypothetical protein
MFRIPLLSLVHHNTYPHHTHESRVVLPAAFALVLVRVVTQVRVVCLAYRTLVHDHASR